MTSRSLHRAHIGARYCEFTTYNGVAYLAGQVAEHRLDGDVFEQTCEVLDKLAALLEEAGSDKSRILSCQIFLKDVDSIPEMNRAWDAWVVPGQVPPRATVEARMTNSKFLIEIVVSAALR